MASKQSPSGVDETAKEFDILKITKVEKGKKEEEVKLPLGYRFDPCDFETIVYYLFNKIFDRELPIVDVMNEIDHYPSDPNQIPDDDFRHGNDCNEAYYFNYRRETLEETIRSVKGGYWKVDEEDEEVYFRDEDVLVGFKTSMDFMKGEAPNGSETDFNMKEYRLNPSIVPAQLLNDSMRKKIDTYVVCRVTNKAVNNYKPTYPFPSGLFARPVGDGKPCDGPAEDGESN